jgi:hypothetical protein
MTTMSKLTTRTRLQADLTEKDIRAMYDLYESYYDATSLELFRMDLRVKSHVIELHCDGALRGFSTISVFDMDVAGERNRAIFSGDTIIEHAFWGEQALVRAFCYFAGQVKLAAPAQPLYWLLISKGHRTYRYLSAFAHRYYPHHSKMTPEPIRARMECLARAKFGDYFDAQRGVICFPQSRGHLKAQWAQVREQLHEHPAVRFFLARNPRYHEGQELVCLTEFAADNLRSFARQAFLQGMHAASELASAR